MSGIDSRAVQRLVLAALLLVSVWLERATPASASTGALPVVRPIEDPHMGKPDDPSDGLVYMPPPTLQPVPVRTSTRLMLSLWDGARLAFISWFEGRALP